MRYKVGDMVKVREDLIVNERYPYEYKTTWCTSLMFGYGMRRYRGKIGKIIKITEKDADEYFIAVDGRETGWYFNNAMLRPVIGKLNKIIKIRKEKMICIHYLF